MSDNETTDTRLARIEERLVSIIDLLTKQADRSDDHEGRIRVLEAGKWKAAGIMSVVSVIGGTVLGVIAQHLFGA